MNLDKKILNYENVSEAILKEKSLGKKIVFVTGVFDLLHLGHIVFLEFAKSKGDILVVGVGSDRITKQLKGDGRPINNEELRSKMLSALECVDYALINDEDLVDIKINFSKAMELIKPDIFVCPYDDIVLGKKRVLVEKYGGKLIDFNEHKKGDYQEVSTTSIILKKEDSN